MGGAQLHTPQLILGHVGSQGKAPNQDWSQMSQMSQMSQAPPLLLGERLWGQEQSEPKYPPMSSKYRRTRLKRKNKEFQQTTINMKKFITEEIMAAHFQDLRISSDQKESSYKKKNGELNAEPKLVLSEDLKRLQDEPILPASLLAKLKQPSMALVLWEPPDKHLRNSLTPRNVEDRDDNRNNNSESIPDLNRASSADSVEPMDL